MASTGEPLLNGTPRGSNNRRGGDGQSRGRFHGRGGARGGAANGESNSFSRGGRNHRGGRRGRGDKETSEQKPPQRSNGDVPVETPNGTTEASSETKPDDDAASDTSLSVCFICADPVKYFSIAPCNHVTCYICSLRMRALYKTKACAHCRTESEFVIFSKDETKRFEEYKDSDIVSQNDALGVKYVDQSICDDTTLLLRYNCPDPSCDRACLGWPDLHRHVRSAHNRVMCDLCTRNKKVFTHEHTLFTPQELRKHERTGDDQPGSENQSGFKGHPECGFCQKRFYSADELYEHCRDKHERCHICDRRNRGNNPQYYINYDALEVHFKEAHFMCPDEECLEKKFVVFENEIDLKAHQLEQHPNGLSKVARRDARRIDMSNFEDARPFQQQQGRRGDRGGRRGGGGRMGGTRGQQEPEEAPIRTEQQLSRAEIAYHRQMAVQSAQSTTTRTFGGQLTAAEPAFAARAPPNTQAPSAQSVEAPPPRPPPPPVVSSGSNAFPPLAARIDNSRVAAQQQQQREARQQERARNPRPTQPSTPAAPTNRPAMTDEIRRMKHNAVIERATGLLRNDPKKMELFRANVSKFRSGGISAGQLVDNFWGLFDVSAIELGKLINELAELYDDDKKKQDIMKAWNNWRAINEDYPPIAGVSSSAAPASSNRVLSIKSSTAQSSRSSANRQVAWGTASSGPSNPTPQPAGNPNRAGKGATKPTPWAGTSSTPSVSSSRAPARGPGAGAKSEEFPSLPPKKVIPGWTPVKNGREVESSGAVWGAPSSNSAAATNGAEQTEEPVTEGQGRKKKGKQKQLLFHVGL